MQFREIDIASNSYAKKRFSRYYALVLGVRWIDYKGIFLSTKFVLNINRNEIPSQSTFTLSNSSKYSETIQEVDISGGGSSLHLHARGRGTLCAEGFDPLCARFPPTAYDPAELNSSRHSGVTQRSDIDQNLGKLNYCRLVADR